MNKKELLLGDNPFFGVDNLSQERARKKSEKKARAEESKKEKEYFRKVRLKWEHFKNVGIYLK